MFVVEITGNNGQCVGEGGAENAGPENAGLENAGLQNDGLNDSKTKKQ